MESKNKVVVIGVKYDLNLGDYLLVDSFCHLLSKEIPAVEIDYIDIKGRDDFDVFKGKENPYALSSGFRKMRRAIGKCINFLTKASRAKKLKTYYMRHLQDASACIFAGGGIIEYSRYNSDFYIKNIIRIAKQFNVPVILNAVGMLDKYKPTNKRANKLRKALLTEKVVFIGVRENVEWMEEWVNHKKTVQLVCDPACFAAPTYGIEKNKNSALIGIGLIRPNIFRDFGMKVSDDQIADIYASVISAFIEKGYECELFTNGYKGDVLLADLIFNRHKELLFLKETIKNPSNAKELVETIAKYYFVFGSRMHCAITSYSLDIPCVTLCWADKIKAFYDNIGHPERCVYPNNIYASRIYDILRSSSNENDYEKRNKYLLTAFSPIEVIKTLCAK